MESKISSHPLPLVVSMNNLKTVQRLALMLALMYTVFLLSLHPVYAQSIAPSEWQRIHDGLKASHPMPDPENALTSGVSTASGTLFQSDLKTLEKTELPVNAGNGAISPVNRIAGHLGSAPMAVGTPAEMSLQQLRATLSAAPAS